MLRSGLRGLDGRGRLRLHLRRLDRHFGGRRRVVRPERVRGLTGGDVIDGSIATEQVDLVVSLTGYIGDAGLHRQLQVHECYATSGPMKLAAALLGGSSDCLEQESHGAETLTNPEPGFFILGVKSYGRTTSFLMRIGWTQVDEVFSLIAPQHPVEQAL